MPPVRPAPPPLPPDLPVPLDDGGASHLLGREIPSVVLPATNGDEVDLADLAAGKLVLYVFPKMGPPHEKDPPGWNETPGVYGCTQQTCGFRDRHTDFVHNGYAIAGVSAQISPEQREAATRLQIQFPLLADPQRLLGEALDLPTFHMAGQTYYKRLTMIVHEGRIAQFFYPVFPPHKNAAKVLRWILSRRG